MEIEPQGQSELRWMVRSSKFVSLAVMQSKARSIGFLIIPVILIKSWNSGREDSDRFTYNNKDVRTTTDCEDLLIVKTSGGMVGEISKDLFLKFEEEMQSQYPLLGDNLFYETDLGYFRGYSPTLTSELGYLPSRLLSLSGGLVGLLILLGFFFSFMSFDIPRGAEHRKSTLVVRASEFDYTTGVYSYKDVGTKTKHNGITYLHLDVDAVKDANEKVASVVKGESWYNQLMIPADILSEIDLNKPFYAELAPRGYVVELKQEGYTYSDKDRFTSSVLASYNHTHSNWTLVSYSLIIAIAVCTLSSIFFNMYSKVYTRKRRVKSYEYMVEHFALVS